MSRWWKATVQVPVSPENSLVNGHKPCLKTDPAIISAWSNLDFDAAWIDHGPSPMGNPGPYLKVPGGDDSVHRVYCKHQAGDDVTVMKMRGVIVDVRPWFETRWAWMIEVRTK